MEKSFKINNFIINPEVPYIVNSVTNERIRIGKHDLSTLILLCKNAGSIVSKEELLSYAWSGKIVTEASLSQSIRIIRNILGDNGKEQKILKTVSKSGYMLEAEVVQESITDKDLTKLEIQKGNIKTQCNEKKKTNYLSAFYITNIFIFCFFFIFILGKTNLIKDQNEILRLYESNNLSVYSNHTKNEAVKINYNEIEKFANNNTCNISSIFILIGKNISYTIITSDNIIHNKVILIQDKDHLESFPILEDIKNESC